MTKRLQEEQNKIEQLTKVLEENEKKHASELDDLKVEFSTLTRESKKNLEQDFLDRKNKEIARMSEDFDREKQQLTSSHEARLRDELSALEATLRASFDEEKLSLEARLQSENTRTSEHEAELMQRLQDLQKTISIKTDEIVALKTNLTQRDDETTRLKAECESLLAELAAKSNELECAINNSNHVNDELGQTRSELEKTRSELERHISELSEIRREFVEKRGNIESMIKDLGDKDDLIDSCRRESEVLATKLRKSEEESATLQASMRKAETEIKVLGEQLAEKDSLLSEARAQLASRIEEIEANKADHENEILRFKEAWNKKVLELKAKVSLLHNK